MVTSNKKHSENGGTPTGQFRAKRVGHALELDDADAQVLIDEWRSLVPLTELAKTYGLSYHLVRKEIKRRVSDSEWSAHNTQVVTKKGQDYLRTADTTLWNHPNWKGGFRVGEDGYVEVIRPEWYPGKHRYIHWHRIVYCMFNGMQPLPKDCDVHHINGDKMDNRLENLEVLSKSEHTKHHHYLKV